MTSMLAFFNDPTGGLIPIIAMVAIFYFVVMRPMRNEEKARRKRLDEIKKGDKVVFGGGIFGRVSSVEGGVAVVEIADKVKVRVLKSKIEDMQESVLENLAKEAEKDKGKKPADDKQDKREPSTKDGQLEREDDKAKEKAAT